MCRSCHLDTAATLCNVCRFLKEELRQPTPRARENCEYCGAPIASPTEGEDLCLICRELAELVCNSGWLLRAHAEWEKENAQLARRKQQLLGHGGLAA